MGEPEDARCGFGIEVLILCSMLKFRARVKS